jgi:hypothetical protein
MKAPNKFYFNQSNKMLRFVWSICYRANMKLKVLLNTGPRLFNWETFYEFSPHCKQLEPFFPQINVVKQRVSSS